MVELDLKPRAALLQVGVHLLAQADGGCVHDRRLATRRGYAHTPLQRLDERLQIGAQPAELLETGDRQIVAEGRLTQHDGLAHREDALDVGLHGRHRGRGQRDQRHRRQPLAQHAQLLVLRSEVVTPSREAVCLVDRDQDEQPTRVQLGEPRQQVAHHQLLG